MKMSTSIANLALALSKAQAELSNPKKTSNNPFFKSKYADLSEVINASKIVLSEHGLSIVQLLSFDNTVNVETMMIHSTGEFISETLSMPVAKHDAQSIGAVCTYARRYAWAAICGLAQEDDDGNAAVGSSQKSSHSSNNSARNNNVGQSINQPYPKDKFEANKASWRELIDSGKQTSASIIGKLKLNGTLTDDQIKEIESFEAITGEIA